MQVDSITQHSLTNDQGKKPKCQQHEMVEVACAWEARTVRAEIATVVPGASRSRPVSESATRYSNNEAPNEDFSGNVVEERRGTVTGQPVSGHCVNAASNRG